MRRESIEKLVTLAVSKRPLAYSASDKFVLYLIKHGYVKHDLFLPDHQKFASDLGDDIEKYIPEGGKLMGVPVIHLTRKAVDYLESKREKLTRRGLMPDGLTMDWVT